jgi:cell division protein ZapA
MAQVNVTINGRQFRMACEDGQEDHLLSLARDIDERIVSLRGQFGEIGDTRLTVMAAITAADELEEARRTIRRLEADLAGMQETRDAAAQRSRQTGQAVASALNSAAERIETAAKRLNQNGGGNGGGGVALG